MTGGPSLRDLDYLLPTPVASDSVGSRNRLSARQPDSRHHDGETLTDTLWRIQGRTENLSGNLLPTPVSRDRKGRRLPSSQGGLDLTTALDATSLLPTPMANPDNPGAGGELRAAITHGPARRNTTGTDSWGRPNLGRPSGASTGPPSPDGSSCSDDPPHGQQTIEGV